MAKHPVNDGKSWRKAELAQLTRLAKQGTAESAAKILGRTPAAVQQKAMRIGVSFRPGQRAARKKK